MTFHTNYPFLFLSFKMQLQLLALLAAAASTAIASGNPCAGQTDCPDGDAFLDMIDYGLQGNGRKRSIRFRDRWGCRRIETGSSNCAFTYFNSRRAHACFDTQSNHAYMQFDDNNLKSCYNVKIEGAHECTGEIWSVTDQIVCN